MNFNLTTIRPKSFLHSTAFAEVKDSLAWALASLGHAANITENWIDSKDTNIIFGAELLAPNQPTSLPPGTIIYNLEQSTHPSFAKVQAIALGSKIVIWDYSLRNIAKHREAGIFAKHVPIGYTPNLTRIPEAEVQDIDILLYGWMTPRRVQIVKELRDAGMIVVATDKCYGGGRDNLISRSKLVLNVHHDGREMFEIVRVSYLLANGARVVTERSEDQEEYSDLADGLYQSGYSGIVEACKNILENTGSSSYLSMPADARRVIQLRDYVEAVRAVLTEPTPQEKVAARYALGSPDIGHYMQLLKDHAKGTILEIGVRDGASTSAFLSGLEQNGGVLLSVDINDCSHLFAGHPQWKFIQSSSQNPKLHAPELDVLFVDGDHSRAGYRADLEKFYPLVKPGGLIISHDIAPEPGRTVEDVPGSDYPSKAIREEYFSFCAERGLTHEEVPGIYGLGVMTKSRMKSVACSCGAVFFSHNQSLCPPCFEKALSPSVEYHVKSVPAVLPEHCGQNLVVADSDESWEASKAVLESQ